MNRFLTRGLLLGVALAGLLLPASAQLTLTITPSPAIMQAGATLSLLATLTNSTGESVDLNAASGNITGPSGLLALDDTAFLIGLPLSLAAGGSYSANLSVLADGTATLGSYSLAYDIDGTGASSTPYTASSSAQIAVIASSAPEPGTLALTLVTLPLLRRKRRRKS